MKICKHACMLTITAACLMFLEWPSNAGARPPMSPSAGSDAALAQTQPESELLLKYRVDREGLAPEIVTIGLAKDYHYKISKLGLWIHDYRLHRIFRVSGAHQYINDSLFGDVWYRRAELENRAGIAAALKKSGIGDTEGIIAQNPFWAETQLGLTTPKFERPSLKRTQTKDRVSWQYNNEEVLAVRYRDETVPSELRGALRRMWPAIANIHPQIADELAASGRMPEELWVRQMAESGKSFELSHWVLTNAETMKSAKYPLPPGLTAGATQLQGAFPQIFDALSAAVADHRKPPTQDVYRVRIESSIDHGTGLEALTWFLEWQLAAGGKTKCSLPADSDVCALGAQAGSLAKTDPRTAIAFAQRSPDEADRAQFDSLPNAYLLRLLWATRPPGKDVKMTESEADLLHALLASPVANFCKDTGDFYARSWQPFAAWQAWDFGRLMAGHVSGDLLDQVDVLEAQLIRNEPTLF